MKINFKMFLNCLGFQSTILLSLKNMTELKFLLALREGHL